MSIGQALQVAVCVEQALLVAVRVGQALQVEVNVGHALEKVVSAGSFHSWRRVTVTVPDLLHIAQNSVSQRHS